MPKDFYFKPFSLNLIFMFFNKICSKHKIHTKSLFFNQKTPMDLESPIDSPREAAKSKKSEREPINNPKEKGVISTKKPERRLKPHEKVAVDYTKDLFAAQEETFDQAPLVIVVQGSKNVKLLIL